jgi:hypothetical protein
MLTKDASSPAIAPKPPTSGRLPTTGRHYPIRYSIHEYTFPTDDTIETITFDDRYIHIEFVDERVLSIPLAWIPPLRDASPGEREKYRLSEDRDAIIWDPEESEVNEILRLSDYLAAHHP